MIALTCISLVFGSLLGYRQTIVILVPAMLLTLVVSAEFGIATGLGVWPTVLTIISAVTGLQIGYLASAATRIMLMSPGARAHMFRKASRADTSLSLWRRSPR